MDQKLRGEVVQLSVRTNRDEEWDQVSDPEEHIQALLPQDVRAIMFDFEGYASHLIFQQSHPNLLSIPGFRAWAGDRIEKSHFAALGGQGDRAVKLLKHHFAGKEHPEAMGIVHLACLHTMMLFSEWLLAAESLPPSWQHLRGQPLPWMLDSTFVHLDVWSRHEAAKLLTRSKSQIVLAASPIQLEPPVETVLEPRLGRLHLLRTGDNYFGDSSGQMFGKPLVLSREDGTHFSESVSAGNDREHQRHG